MGNAKLVRSEELQTPTVLKELRVARGYTLEQAANIVGTSKQYLHSVENGRLHRPYELANLYAEKFRITKDEAKRLKKAILADVETFLRF